MRLASWPHGLWSWHGDTGRFTKADLEALAREFAEELAPLGHRVLDPSRPPPAPVLSGWNLERGRFGPIPKTEQRRSVSGRPPETAPTVLGIVLNIGATTALLGAVAAQGY